MHQRLALDAAAHLERVLRVENPPTIESLAKKVFVEFVVPPVRVHSACTAHRAKIYSNFLAPVLKRIAKKK